MDYNTTQRHILTMLLDKYESSATYKGQNKVKQSFSVLPEEIFREYHSNFANIDKVHEFENNLKLLEEDGLVKTDFSGDVYTKIYANLEKIEEYYRILRRKEKDQIKNENIAFYKSYLQDCPIVKRFCEEEISRLINGKNPTYDRKTATGLFTLCNFLHNNTEPLFEREVSMELSDSKVFYKEYKARLCTLLRKYGNIPDEILSIDDEKERNKTILAEYNVFSNPTYVEFTGNGKVIFKNGTVYQVMKGIPLSFRSDVLSKIDKIIIDDQKIMTVENLTSYNTMNTDSCFFVYLAGYHNTSKQRLLQMIAAQNPEKEWYHFGDMDPDGFYILDVLRRKTGIDFKPMLMRKEYLTEYEKYTKPLEKHDVDKAYRLIDNHLYSEEMEEMLRLNRKLEQEIISRIIFKKQ